MDQKLDGPVEVWLSHACNISIHPNNTLQDNSMALEEAEAADRQHPAADSPQIAKDQYTADNLPAAFWDEYPQDSENTDLAAINAILEESTPDERAETWKVTQPAVRSEGPCDSEQPIPSDDECYAHSWPCRGRAMPH
jgi:hypothetical protein